MFSADELPMTIVRPKQGDPAPNARFCQQRTFPLHLENVCWRPEAGSARPNFSRSDIDVNNA
jgi:hypothetical protein